MHGSAEAEVDRVEAGRHEGAVVEGEDRQERLPVAAVRGEQPGAVAAQSVVVAAQGGRSVGGDLGVVLGGDAVGQFDLADDVAEAVEDRPVPIQLDTAKEVRAVPDHDVCALVDHPVGEGTQELARCLGRRAGLVGVHAHHD
ncbi:MAG TPA: hypothetical protein VJT72_02275, partial [Pseudonocardiaceae bacterium]|nr:hypothetical protein [Pseudonocardiaceae bacterium]